MIARRALEAADRNDALAAEVAAAADRCRETGAVGDLVRLRDLRLRVGQEIGPDWATGWSDGPVPAAADDLFADAIDRIPEIDARDLAPQLLASAMRHHGALAVRNLIDPGQARTLRHGIAATFDAANALAALSEGCPDDRPTTMKADYLPLREDAGLPVRRHKTFLGESGAVETFLSPRMAFELFELFEGLGLRALLQAYFRDEPCVSFNKSVLRRTAPLAHPAEWHQDGAFMTEGIASLNLWIALSECGGDTDCPGMDLVPRRVERVLPTGEDGAIFGWSISGRSVASTFPDVAPERPTFAPGDAILFDHLNLHATSSDPAYTRTRYAIETWFFAKSRAAINQHPAFW